VSLVRFDIRPDEQGWTIFDRETDQPASVEGMKRLHFLASMQTRSPTFSTRSLSSSGVAASTRVLARNAECGTERPLAQFDLPLTSTHSVNGSSNTISPASSATSK
jgi:hypothetical protein